MILQSFILGSLCREIINSVFMVGLYYGFLTTFSIGPSYLLHLRTILVEKGEEGAENKVAATMGFIMGQLMMFISIYYTPLHLALDRPHTITALTIPCLFFYFLWNNRTNFFDYDYGYGFYVPTYSNSIRNLRIQSVFLHNFIFQLLNHFIFPSAILTRLVNIYMFRCNHKILFLISSFLGWLVGHLLFLKLVDLIGFGVEQYNLIMYKRYRYIRNNKYFVAKMCYTKDRIFSILLFITFLYNLGRIRFPILNRIMQDPYTMEFDEDRFPFLKEEIEEEIILPGEGGELNFEGIKSSLEYVEEEIDDDNYEKEILKGRKPLAPFEFEQTFLFDFRLWVRPLVYRDDAAKLEASQYFFYPCQSDGKERISFTYPPSLSTFWKMIERKMSLFTIEKPLSDDLCDHWSYTNEQKKNNLSTEFRKRIEALGKKRSSLRNVLEKRIRLDKRMKINYFNLYLNILSSQNVILSSSLAEETQKKDYLPNQYDPLLAGPRRTKIKEPFSYLAQPTYTYKNQKNKIFNLLFKSKKRELYLEPKEIPGKYSFTSIYVDAEELDLRKGIRKMIYKYFDDVEYAQGVSGPHIVNEYQIRTRKFKPIIWYTYDGKDIEKGDRNYLPGVREMFWLEYSRLRKDIKRELIIGSMPNLRRKSDSFNLAQIRLHSTLFLTEVKSYLIFVLEVLFEFLVIPIYKLLLFILTKGKMQKNKDDEAEEYAIGEVNFSLENLEKLEGRKGQELLELPDEYYYISDEYDPFLDEASYYPSFRALVLLAHVVLRKYILFPSLIIVKNLVRILFHEPPEWSEDFADLKKEVYVICDHEGKAASHTEWPKEWLTDGIEIKVFFPFTLKPWHNKEYDKVPKEDVCFLNILGMETEYIYGRPRKKPPFLKPVLKELKKKIRKWKNKLKSFVLKLSLKKGTESFPNVSKETKERERSELSETKKEKDLIMSNQMIDESSVPIEFRDSIDYSFTEPKMIDESSVPIEILDLDLIVDYSLTEQEMKNLTNRTSTIRNQIDKMRKFQEELLLTPEVNIISSNKPSFPQKLVPSIKKILQKLKRRNARLMHKFYYFIRYLMQRIYIDIIVRIVLIFQLNTVLFYKNFYKFFLKYVSPCTNKLKKPRKFISIIQNSLSYIKNENSKILCDLSSLSQAYVFYKLYQTRLIKLSELRYALQYHGTSLFLKNEIKDFFEAEEIFHSELKHKNLLNSGMKQWKNWLRIHYQYDLSPIRWYHLVPQKWRTKVNQQRMDENKDLNKGDSDEKTDQLIHSKKLNDFEANSLSNKNYYNFQKWYRYDLFSSKSINYEDKKDSYIYVPPPCINKKKEDISYNYNIYKRRIFDLPEGFLGFKNFEGFMSFKIPIGQFSIMNPEIFPDRKYFDGMLFPFCLKNKVDIESWIDIETNDSQNITPRVNKNRVNKNYQLFDWMRMNEKILSHPTSTHHHPLWFLPEVVPRYKKYKKRLWTIRTKFLLFNSNGYVTFMENINLENLYMETYPYNMKKDVLRKRVKKKTTKKDFNISVDAQQDCVEEGYPYCQVFSDLDDILEAYIERDTVVLKLKKKHRKRSALAFLRGESVDLDFTEFRGELVFRQWKSQGVIDVEGIATTRHNKEQFIIYQMINIALLHKSKSPWPLLHKPKRTPQNPPRYIHAENYVWSIWLKERKKKKREKNYSDLFAPEKILSTKRRRELRILISFYSKNGNVIQKNPVFCKYVKNCGEVLDKSKKEKKKIKKLKLFLWPNYRLEDLACMNRYWFHTNNSSRFSMLRLYMYPPLFRLLRLPWANPYTFSI
uniref:hypothetical chloroplast RF1 n=1 Tax=Ludwigia adscendens TaxID=1241825 RepID=UPI0026E49626|nr:hypothetical chloroplast RF1 [Ludwigia adscendens]WJO89837.1 hypothetical chloroplast RF1 [Ludwigia adscendens]WMY92977.1 hypothetical chloroplast RF19 [Ludwigia adscendens]